MKSGHMADAADRQTSTHVVLDVQVAAGFEQDTHNLNVAFVGSQVQGAPAILWTKNTHTTQPGKQNTHTHTQREHTKFQQEQTELSKKKPTTHSHSHSVTVQGVRYCAICDRV